MESGVDPAQVMRWVPDDNTVFNYVHKSFLKSLDLQYQSSQFSHSQNLVKNQITQGVQKP